MTKTHCYECGSRMVRNNLPPKKAKYVDRDQYKASDYTMKEYFCEYSCTECDNVVRIRKDGRIDRGFHKKRTSI